MLMSSKNSNKKSDDKEEEKALKEAEIVAELAPDQKTKKEAEKLIETVESQSNTFARDSSEIFDTYKKGLLKITEELSKFQPQYAQSISNLMEEYLQLTKEFVDKFFAAQRNWIGGNITSRDTTFPSWTYTPYVEQFRTQSSEITAQASSVFDTSNQLAMNALNIARENVKLYRKAIDAMMEFNNNVANAWSSFLTPAQRQQYFRQ
jgi:hypothetical protein